MVETCKSKSIGRSVCVPGCPFACVPMCPKKYLSSDLSIHKKNQSAYEKNEKWSRISTSYLGYPQNKRSPQKFKNRSSSFFQDKYQELRERESRELVGEVSGRETNG